MKRILGKKKLLIFIVALALVLIAGGAFAWTTMRNNNSNGTHDYADTAEANDQPAVVNKETPDAPAPTPAAFDKSQHSLSDPASIWVVANKQRPLQPLEYAPSDLTDVGDGHRMRAEAASAFAKLQSSASAAGHVLTVESGYRSYNTQVATYNRWVNELGKTEADRQSARPGHSEHQTGLALDVGGDGCNVEECFGSKPSGIWVAAHAHEYGFIVRYPDGKEHVTGYLYEPWHLRYVGAALATEMQRTGVTTMEEFFGLPAAPSYN